MLVHVWIMLSYSKYCLFVNSLSITRVNIARSCACDDEVSRQVVRTVFMSLPVAGCTWSPVESRVILQNWGSIPCRVTRISSPRFVRSWCTDLLREKFYKNTSTSNCVKAKILIALHPKVHKLLSGNVPIKS